MHELIVRVSGDSFDRVSLNTSTHLSVFKEVSTPWGHGRVQTVLDRQITARARGFSAVGKRGSHCDGISAKSQFGPDRLEINVFAKISKHIDRSRICQVFHTGTQRCLDYSAIWGGARTSFDPQINFPKSSIASGIGTEALARAPP